MGKRPHTQRPSGSEDAGTWPPAVCPSHGDPAASHSGKAAAKACFRNDPRGDLQPGEACHSPVMFFVHQVVPGPERHQVSIVCWGRDGHGACAAHVGVTQLVGEDLQLIRGETIVVPKHVIVGRPACSLKADRGSERRPGLPCNTELLRQAALSQTLHKGHSGRILDKQVTMY